MRDHITHVPAYMLCRWHVAKAQWTRLKAGFVMLRLTISKSFSSECVTHSERREGGVWYKEIDIDCNTLPNESNLARTMPFHTDHLLIAHSLHCVLFWRVAPFLLFPLLSSLIRLDFRANSVQNAKTSFIEHFHYTKIRLSLHEG